MDKNRRHADRFPVERDVRFKVTRNLASWPKYKQGGPPEESAPAIGNGKTLNVSSAGVLFTAANRLTPGSEVEVSIDWPAQLNQTCALRLVGRGRVVRSLDGQAAVHVQNYEFRTQGKTPAKPPAKP